ncbi:MAG: hypothetical protein IPJ41_05270 [Phycisphaerales bacterium]|nr:hypothetical protein [Phycisphaerales bacterium]
MEARLSVSRAAATGVLLMAAVGAQAQYQIGRLAADDGVRVDRFGWAVAVTSDTGVVGAPYADPVGQNSGAAYVFGVVGGEWAQTTKLVPSDGRADDLFGYAVGIDSGTICVGSRNESELGEQAGAVYVFEPLRTGWTQVAKLVAADGASYDHFGCSVALSGDVMVVGAQDKDLGGVDRGAVYLFERIAGVWTQVASFADPDPQNDQHFGACVAVSDETAVVGALADNDSAFYVFERVGGVWSPTAHFRGRGARVGVSGDVILAGAPKDDPFGALSGAAFVFERVDGAWVFTQRLLAGDGAAYDEFGTSVSVRGEAMIVGARGHENYAGAAYFFGRVGGVWVPTAEVTAIDHSESDSFGWSASLAGDAALVGAPNSRDAQGSAYVFGMAPCLADFNADYHADTRDVLAFLNAWNAGDSSADWDQNGVIDTRDLLAFLDDWVAGC